jgi:hypothetical protein
LTIQDGEPVPPRPHDSGVSHALRETGAPKTRSSLGEPIRPPIIASARGPPLWDMPEAARGQLNRQAQPVPGYEFDQRIAW